MPLIVIRMRRVCCRSLALIVVGWGATGAQARAPAPERPPSLLRQVIPKPTGQNGYEELVAAGDALRGSKRFAALERGGGTLDAKRRALRDPPVIRALALIRRGLNKPILSPRETVSTAIVFPEFGAFRSLARLLAMQQYVFLAEGRVSEAIESMRLGLKLARAVQTDTLLSGLVGVAMSAVGTRQLGAHLDQLSVRDCEQLYRVCVEWLRVPDPARRILAAEREFIRQTLAERRESPSDLTVLLGLADEGRHPSDPGTIQARQTVADLKRLKAGSAAEYAAFVTALEKRFDERFERILEEFEKPAWARKFPAPEEEDLAGRVVSLLLPAFDRVSNHYTVEQARIRLLACHAAIRRYHWEYDRLPPHLNVLRLGELAIDPFTGQPLKYEPRGARYRLTSVGPQAEPDDPQAVEGRRPVSVVPGE